MRERGPLAPDDSGRRLGLTTRILAGMLLGVVAGVALNQIPPGAAAAPWVESLLLDGALHVVGSIFLASLRLLVVPLVFVSLVCGTASLDDLGRLGRVGGKTLALYLFTTAVAVSLAVATVSWIQPGLGGPPLPTGARFEPAEPQPLVNTLINLFPTNPVRAMAEGNMLQIIVFSILFGLAACVCGEPGRRLLAVFRDLNEVIMRLVMLLMSLAPYGVFCLIARVFAREGFGAILDLARYFFLVLAVLLLHVLLTYPLLLRLGGLSPVLFFRKMRDPLALAFSTASSNATLPVTLENVERRLGAHSSIASFTVPLGATINMDGTAIMQGVAAGFIAQVYGIDLGLSGYLTIVLTAVLASIGTAGVPGVGIVMLTMVLRQVGLPVEGIALILGVDRLLDMVRTAVNITGDSVVTCLVARSEGRFSDEVFRRLDLDDLDEA